jgi:hypothetical protein
LFNAACCMIILLMKVTCWACLQVQCGSFRWIKKSGLDLVRDSDQIFLMVNGFDQCYIFVKCRMLSLSQLWYWSRLQCWANLLHVSLIMDSIGAASQCWSNLLFVNLNFDYIMLYYVILCYISNSLEIYRLVSEHVVT